MEKYQKLFLVFLIGAAILMSGIGLAKCVLGNYIVNSPINFSLMFVAWVAFIGISKGWIKQLLMISVGAMLLTSCEYAKSNQQVVISSDCGMTWSEIKVGESVPKGGMNVCYMKVVIPNYPMQGEARFICNLKDRVRARVHIDYDYSIIEPLEFIKQAKFLGKANTSADDESAIGKAFEGAENMVIDKRIKDIAKGVFITEDIVELDQSDMEEHLHAEANKVLEKLGIHLNFITLTFDLDDQTRQAIDVSTAMTIYRSKKLDSIGADVIINRAGATKIEIINQEDHKEE